MGEHTETVSPKVVSALWQGSKAVQDNDVPWVAALQLIGEDGNAVLAFLMSHQKTSELWNKIQPSKKWRPPNSLHGLSMKKRKEPWGDKKTTL